MVKKASFPPAVAGFYQDTRKINFAAMEPTMTRRSMRNMAVRCVKKFSPVDSDGKARPLGWYIRCNKCQGTGIWDNERAVEDLYHSQKGRYTCFLPKGGCGATNNGWFRAPDLEYYQQACMLWVMACIDSGNLIDVRRVANSEVGYAQSLFPEFDPDSYICQMARFWQKVLRAISRREETGVFLTPEDIDASPMLQRTDRAWKALKLKRSAKLVSFPPALVAALKHAWDSSCNPAT